jgi:hypothetical protein
MKMSTPTLERAVADLPSGNWDSLLLLEEMVLRRNSRRRGALEAQESLLNPIRKRSSRFWE